VLEALNVEFLNPGIDRILQIMRRAGQWPEFPPDLDGVPLRVEYTSILAQAQKAVKTIAIEQGINFAATTAQFLPAVLDRIDSDGLMDEYFDGIGFPPKAILSIREAEQARQARADQQQAPQQLDATSQVAAAARDGAAATEAIQPNVLQQLLAAPCARKIRARRSGRWRMRSTRKRCASSSPPRISGVFWSGGWPRPESLRWPRWRLRGFRPITGPRGVPT